MPDYTPTFGFLMLDPATGDSLAIDGYKFVQADPQLHDALLRLALTHDHTGGGGGEVDPPEDAPEALVDEEGGAIAAGRRLYYRYTLVDERGLESEPSPVGFVDTPTAIDVPERPVVTFAQTGGTLIPGDYYYILTAYRTVNTSETLARNAGYIVIITGTLTNRAILELPELPLGADGFNVYRRAPGAAKYFHLDSIDMTVATPPDTYIDDGSVEEDCDRSLPIRATIYATNSVTVTIGGATPAVPEGFTWKLYRSYNLTDWDNTLLAWIVDETFPSSGLITPEYSDIGAATASGAPPGSGIIVSAPGAVDLTDGAAVNGQLPPVHVAYPHVVEFAFPGPLEVLQGSFVWRCPFDTFLVTEVLVNLGRDSAPAVNAVIVDVDKCDNTLATPSWATLFTNQANRPRIEVGDQLGDPAVPDVTVVRRDDLLTADIDQIGGGATPTDEDLLVQIVGYVYDPRTTSVTFP